MEYVPTLLFRLLSLNNLDRQDKRNKFSRKRLNEDEGDITYINERNRVFNKKVCPFLFQVSFIAHTRTRTDRTVLRQIYRRNPCQFRAWYGPIVVIGLVEFVVHYG